MSTTKLLNVKELSLALNVPVSWIYQKTSSSSMPYYKMGKYVRFDLDVVKDYFKTSQSSLSTGECNVSR